MKSFLRENWLWILLPAALLVALLILSQFFAGSGDPPGTYAL